MAEGVEVGSIFYKARIDPDGAKKGASEISSHLDILKSKFNSLNPTVRALGLSLGVYLSGKTVVDFFKSSIEAANESNRVMAQTNAVLASTGGVAGYTAQQISQMATSIQNTTPIADEAAQAGINMLLTFTNIRSQLPAATQAMVDMATAMNGGVTPGAEELRGTAIQLGKALQDPVVGMTALRRVGVAFTDTQMEMVQGMVDNNNLMGAQKFILGELSKEFGGSAAAQAKTFEGRMQMLGNTINNFQEDVGNAVIPAITYLTTAFSGAGGQLDGLLGPIKAVTVGFIALGLVAKEVGILISTVLAAGFQVLTGNFSIAKGVLDEGFKEMVKEGANAQEAMSAVWNKETNKQVGISKKGFDAETEGSGKKSAKIKKDLEDETAKYNDELIKRNKRFDESLTDMIFAHQDKVKKFKKDIDDENTDFNEKMSDRLKDFKQTMDDMKKDHEEKTAELQKDLNQETATHDEKTAKIQALIDKELSYGKNARQSKIQGWMEELEQEKTSYDEKVTAIQEKIATEDQSYADQVLRKQTADAEENARLTEQHAQRVADYQVQLNEEQAILDAHATEVAGVKDKQKEDDIQRLIRQHNEENIEADKQHQKKMVDIVNQGKSEGAAGGGAYKAAVEEQVDKLKASLEKTNTDIAKSNLTSFENSGKESGMAYLQSFIDGISNAARNIKNAGGGLLGDALSALPGLGTALNIWSMVPQMRGGNGGRSYASGGMNVPGGLSLVGENGPELVNLPKGSDVFNANETASMMNGSTINIYVDHISSQMDIESIGREIGFRAGVSPR